MIALSGGEASFELIRTGELVTLKVHSPGYWCDVAGVSADELALVAEQCWNAAIALRALRALRGDGAYISPGGSNATNDKPGA